MLGRSKNTLKKLPLITSQMNPQAIAIARTPSKEMVSRAKPTITVLILGKMESLNTRIENVGSNQTHHETCFQRLICLPSTMNLFPLHRGFLFQNWELIFYQVTNIYFAFLRLCCLSFLLHSHSSLGLKNLFVSHSSFFKIYS